MSHRSVIMTWEAAVAKLLRNQQRELDLEVVVLTCLGLIADTATNHYVTNGITPGRWFESTLSLGIEAIYTKCKQLSDYLREKAPRDVNAFQNFWIGFKHQINVIFGRGPLPAVLRRIIEQDDRTNVNGFIHIFQKLESVLCFLRKVDVDDSSLHDAMLDAFRETCTVVQAFNESDSDLPLIVSVRDRISKMFPWEEYANSFYKKNCKFGPGSSRELTRRQSNFITRLRYLHGDCLLSKWAEYPSEVTFVPRVSKMETVPKSIERLRTIAKEPVSLMWAQQSLKEYMYSMLNRMPGINLNQESGKRFNSEMALLASLDGEWSTIDCSNASDSVSLRIFNNIFRDTFLKRAILDTRSESCDLDGELVELPMVATMGSAVCFAIETAVFYSIADSVLSLLGCSDHPYVFGDDVIVPTAYVSMVIDAYEKYGFTINRSKSFTHRGQAFRESCGVNAIFGVDVTPLMWPRFVQIGKRTEDGICYQNVDRPWLIKHFSALTQLSERSCNLVRSFIIRLLRRYHLPYLTPERSSYCFCDPNNREFLRSRFRRQFSGRISSLDSGAYLYERRWMVKIPHQATIQRPINWLDDESRWFVYWHFPMYDQDGFYIGPDLYVEATDPKMVPITIAYDFIVITARKMVEYGDRKSVV